MTPDSNTTDGSLIAGRGPASSMTECWIRRDEAVIITDDGTVITIPRASSDPPAKTARSIAEIVRLDSIRYEVDSLD